MEPCLSYVASISTTDRLEPASVLTACMCPQTTGGVCRVPGGAARAGGVPGVRRSLPNMATSHLLHEPAKLYPYHLLLITNYRLPPDVDRLNLEVSL